MNPRSPGAGSGLVGKGRRDRRAGAKTRGHGTSPIPPMCYGESAPCGAFGRQSFQGQDQNRSLTFLVYLGHLRHDVGSFGFVRCVYTEQGDREEFKNAAVSRSPLAAIWQKARHS
jgi:hypothetical protein